MIVIRWGGGRSRGAPFAIETASGERLFQGVTDAEGGINWTAPGAGDHVVIVDAQDGHAAKARIPASRFGGAAAAAPPVSSAAAQPPPPAAQPSPEIEALIAAAVRREMPPLLERIEMMDNRLRFTDVLSGVFLLLGAAGGALWLRTRRGER